MLRQGLAALGPFAIVLLGLSSAVYQPLGPDVFVVAASPLGISPALAALLAVFSTTVGSAGGYLVGRGALRSLLSPLLRRHQDAVARAADWLRRRGVWVAAVAGLTPIPLTQVAWAAGVVRMPLLRFLLGVLLGVSLRFGLEAAFSNVLAGWLHAL